VLFILISLFPKWKLGESWCVNGVQAALTSRHAFSIYSGVGLAASTAASIYQLNYACKYEGTESMAQFGIFGYVSFACVLICFLLIVCIRYSPQMKDNTRKMFFNLAAVTGAALGLTAASASTGIFSACYKTGEQADRASAMEKIFGENPFLTSTTIVGSGCFLFFSCMIILILLNTKGWRSVGKTWVAFMVLGGLVMSAGLTLGLNSLVCTSDQITNNMTGVLDKAADKFNDAADKFNEMTENFTPDELKIGNVDQSFDFISGLSTTHLALIGAGLLAVGLMTFISMWWCLNRSVGKAQAAALNAIVVNQV